MNKLKKFLIFVVIFVIAIYGLFFAGVYAFSDLTKYMPELKKIVKETVGLDIDVKTAKLTPTPKVEIKLDIQDFQLKYPASKK